MKLSEMIGDLDELVEDDSLKQSFANWINDAILEIAKDIDLPALKLLSPVTLDVDSNGWIWPLPSTFHKKLFRCNFIDGSGRAQKVTVYDRRDDLEYRDHTRIEPAITGVAVATQGHYHYLLIDPLPKDPVELNLWFYRKPTLLEKADDICDCIPPEFHRRVIMPKVVVRNYQALMDQVVSSDFKSISFWEGEYSKGLYGGAGIGPGLLRVLARDERPPRRTGGRDPVGYRTSR